MNVNVYVYCLAYILGDICVCMCMVYVVYDMYSRTEHFLPEGYMDQEKVDRQINIKKSQEWCQLTSESVWKK